MRRISQTAPAYSGAVLLFAVPRANYRRQNRTDWTLREPRPAYIRPRLVHYSVDRLLLYLAKSPRKKRSGNLCSATSWHGPGKEHAVTWLLVMALEISVVMAFGFVLGRVWPLHDQRPVLMADYEVDAGDFT